MLGTFTPEMLQLLERWIGDRRPMRFAEPARRDLVRLLGNAQQVELIEAMCEIRQFTDRSHHLDSRRAVLRLLRRDGISLGRGKQADPAMRAFVESVAPMLVAFGCPLRSGEDSRLVRLLRLVAWSCLGMSGDPRDEVRRSVRDARRSAANARELVLAAAMRAWNPEAHE